ncbi:MAG: 3-dehydroquinate synthase [Bacteroidales bacterium]|nr:3-dehydroquinate synthase [Bacteroidales bacterium]
MIKEISAFSEIPVAEGSFVVYDANVAWIAEQIIGPGVLGSVAVEATEENKTMDTVLLICRSMMEAGLSRGGEVVCVGGGITSDLGGFAASIFKRGVSYVNVPTTLLAQVDAGIGGKTGVNFDGLKNMLGAIVQPRVTYICAEALKTLPRRELLCGLAEMLKTFLIADVSAYEGFCRCGVSVFAAEKCRKNTSPTSAELINRAASIKQGIVEEDPFEKGRRAVLNLGHTFAHGIEHVALERGDDVAHGEAVAMGIVLAARLGDRLYGTALEPRIAADFGRIGLPVECPYALENLVSAMTRDKKGAGEKVKFVLLEDIGKPKFEMLAPARAVEILSR